MLTGQSRVLVQQPEDLPWSFGPEIVEHHVLEPAVCTLVLEVSDDTRAGKAGDLSGRHEPVEVIPQGIFIDTGHSGECLHINAGRCGNCLVNNMSCIMLQHILL